MFKLYTMFAQEKWFSVNLKRCVCVCILPEMVKRPPSIDVHTLVRKNSKLQIMLVLWDRIFLVPAETDRERQREREKGGYTDEYVVNFRKWCEKCSGTEWSSSFQSCSPPIGRTLRSDPFWPMRCIVMRVLDPSGPFLKYTHSEKIWSPPHVDYYYLV